MKNDKREDNANVIIDPATGLPKLPAGWYFQSERGWSRGVFMRIYATRKKRFLWWTYTSRPYQTEHSGYALELDKKGVYKAAVDAYNSWQSWRRSDTNLLGKFPPNTVK